MTGDVVLVYAGDEPPEVWDASLFLAGPSPRDVATSSWRPPAAKYVKESWDTSGTLVVFVPEARDGVARPSYDDQIAWEDRWLAVVDVIAFWVPRDMDTLPGLTTNVEFGRYESSGRIVFGAPDDAVHVSYLRHFAELHGAPVRHGLKDTITTAIEMIGDGARRAGGQRDVPLLVWRTPHFQNWLSAQQAARNELRSGRLMWTFRVGPGQFVLFWAFHAAIYVAAEDRVKSNEVVISRPDVATVVAYRRAAALTDTEVVLVREFRSPATSADGFVRELPGGAGFKPAAPVEQATSELEEEISLVVDAPRIRAHGSRQPVATLSAHRQHVFSVELTEAEIAHLRTDSAAHGNPDESERTYVEIHRLGDLLATHDVDWATLGILTQVLLV